MNTLETRLFRYYPEFIAPATTTTDHKAVLLKLTRPFANGIFSSKTNILAINDLPPPGYFYTKFSVFPFWIYMKKNFVAGIQIQLMKPTDLLKL